MPHEKLARVSQEFADHRDVDRKRVRNLFRRRERFQFAGKLHWIKREIIGHCSCAAFNRLFDPRHVLRFCLHGNFHPWAHLERSTVYFLAVDHNVAMGDELLGAKDRGCEFEPIDDIIQTAFQLLDESSVSIFFNARGFLIVATIWLRLSMP